VFARSGLVADPPTRRQTGTQTGLAGLVADEPRNQLVLRAFGKCIAKDERLDVPQHCGRRGGVARVAGYGFVQVRFDAIEACNGVAKRSHVVVQCLRPTETGENKISGRVVADRHGGGAQFANRHSVAAGTFLGDRGVNDDVACLELYPAIELLLAVIDPLEHGRCSQKLEGAAHRKALVGPMTGEAV